MCPAQLPDAQSFCNTSRRHPPQQGKSLHCSVWIHSSCRWMAVVVRCSMLTQTRRCCWLGVWVRGWLHRVKLFEFNLLYKYTNSTWDIFHPRWLTTDHSPHISPWPCHCPRHEKLLKLKCIKMRTSAPQEHRIKSLLLLMILFSSAWLDELVVTSPLLWFSRWLGLIIAVYDAWRGGGGAVQQTTNKGDSDQDVTTIMHEMLLLLLLLLLCYPQTDCELGRWWWWWSGVWVGGDIFMRHLKFKDFSVSCSQTRGRPKWTTAWLIRLGIHHRVVVILLPLIPFWEGCKKKRHCGRFPKLNSHRHRSAKLVQE